MLSTIALELILQHFLGQKNNIFDPIKERGINVHLIVGNHDSYYKNTNDVNAVDLLLREYDNVNVYSEATEDISR